MRPDVPPSVDLLCGSVAYFDHSSGMSYRCSRCIATVGSVGMPRYCKNLYEQQDIVDKLKGTPNETPRSP